MILTTKLMAEVELEIMTYKNGYETLNIRLESLR
jgi:hypothetical protein